MNSDKPQQSFKVDELRVRIFPSGEALAEAAAAHAHLVLTQVLARQEEARVILATGNSQIQFLELLASRGGIDWSRVTLFHMDEYLGIDETHRASFRRYMREKVDSKLRPRKFHYIEGDALLPLKECQRYTGLLAEKKIDLCCLGIGENGHLAFNDPPVADFDDPPCLKIVKLDDACKLQQVNEGHFASLATVPAYAFTLTIPALAAAGEMICICPEQRKAKAVQAALEGPISTACPASFLRKQSHAALYLDQESAHLLGRTA